jgi:Ni/Co efflux regulator RcnB
MNKFIFKKLLLSAAFALTMFGPVAQIAAASPDWRDGAPNAHWDASKHNGYWYNNKWRTGPPPQSLYGKPGLSLGWHDWAKGQRIPTEDRRRFAEVDYRQHHLRRPPHGYHWVQDDKGNFLLAAVASGVIADLIINAH